MGDDEQRQVRTSPYASPMYNYGSSIVTLTSPDDELYKMEMSLKGLREDDRGNVVKVGEPLLNTDGINSVMSQVQALMSRVSIMSNFDKYDVPAILDFLGDTLAKDLMLNRVDYGIVSPSVRDKVYFLVLASAWTALKRGYEEGDRRFWKGSQQDITTRVEQAQGNSMLKSLFGLARNK